MKASMRFFTEWRAMKAFIAATGILCVGILGFKEKTASFSPWFIVAFAGLVYVWSCFLWGKSQGKNRRQKGTREPEITHRNPAAKLPPRRPLPPMQT
jgi:hypothetical protein